MRYFKGIFLILFIVFHSCSLLAQSVSVSAKLDTNAMLIGDHIGLMLEFKGPANSSVRWPAIPDTILGNISVIGRGKIDTTFSTDGKSVIYAQNFNLTCYDSGFYTIPQISFYYKLLPDNADLKAASGLLLLAVHTVKVDTTQAIKPIIGPLSIPITFREMLPWILAGLAGILLVLLVLWYLSRRRKQQPIIRFKPQVIVLPHELALQALEKLRIKKLWQSGKVKEYYSELTDIIRKYVEDRYKVPALEFTTGELMHSLLDLPDCPRKAVDSLGELLMRADLVKFAKLQPLATENDESFTTSTTFVYDTIERITDQSVNQA